jgi:ATP/maltotriose-dependent transcriptional regulator MalT
MEPLPLLEETIQFWHQRSSRPLTHEDARQMVENVSGFFTTLQRWSAAADARKSEPAGAREAA